MGIYMSSLLRMKLAKKAQATVQRLKSAHSAMNYRLYDIMDSNLMVRGTLEVTSVFFSLNECLKTVQTFIEPQAVAVKNNLVFNVDFPCSLKVKSDERRL